MTLKHVCDFEHVSRLHCNQWASSELFSAMLDKGLNEYIFKVCFSLVRKKKKDVNDPKRIKLVVNMEGI